MRNAAAALTTLFTETFGRVAMLLLSLTTARLLEPFEIGVLGLAVIIVSVVSILGSFGETAAIVADNIDDDLRRGRAGTAWRVGITLVVTLFVLLFLDRIAAALGGGPSGAARVRDLTQVLLFQPWLETASVFPRIILRRQGEFGYLARAGLMGTLGLVLTAVPLLLRGHGPFAVVWGQLFATTLSSVLIWRRLQGRPGVLGGGGALLIDIKRVGRESVRLFVGSAGGYASERLDNILVAANLGPTQLSYYSVAWNLFRMPVNVLSQIVYTVVLPAIAIERNDPDRVIQILRNTLRFSYFAMSLGASLLYFVVPGLIEGILGTKWLALGPIFRVLALSLLFIPVHFAAGSHLISHGKAHLIGAISAIHILMQLLLIPPFCARYGVVGAAYVDVGNNFVTSVSFCVALFLSGGSLRWFDWRNALQLTLAAAGAGGIAVGIASVKTMQHAGLSAVLTMTLFPLLASLFGSSAIVRDVAAVGAGWLRRLRR